jgi:hypothetical protein
MAVFYPSAPILPSSTGDRARRRPNPTPMARDLCNAAATVVYQEMHCLCVTLQEDCVMSIDIRVTAGVKDAAAQ